MKWNAWVLVASALVPLRALAADCASQLDCKGGQVCTAGVCVAPECARDLDCGAGRWCSSAGRCEAGTPKAPVVPACLSHLDCTRGQTCAAGVCVAPECTRDLDCGADRWCTSGGRCESGTPELPSAQGAPPPASAPVPRSSGAWSERSWPGFFSSATVGLGGANDGYLQGRDNQSFSGVVVAATGCAGVAVSEQLAVGLDVAFMPMFEDGSFAPFGSVGVLAALRPASWIQLEATFGMTGGGVVAFGGVGPGWSIGLAIPIFTRGSSSFNIGARLPMAYLVEPRTTTNTSFYVAPTLNAGYTIW